MGTSEDSTGRIELHFDSAEEMVQWVKDFHLVIMGEELEEEVPDVDDLLDGTIDHSYTTDWMGY